MIKEISIIASPIVKSIDIINFQIEFNEKPKNGNKPIIILVLDKSGSMSGSAINKAKESANHLINELYNSHDFCLITYANDANTYNFINASANPQELQNKITTQISNIDANGSSTDFCKAFCALTKLISSFDSKPETSIIFLTDGVDTSHTKNNIYTELDNFINCTTKYTTSPQIHCLGFSVDHDAKFLGEMARKSPYNGTFQYIENTSSLNDKMQNLLPLLQSNKLTVYFVNNTKNTVNPINLIEQENKYVGEIFVRSFDNQDKCSIRIQNNDDVQEIEINVKQENTSDINQMEYFNKYLVMGSIKIIEQLSKTGLEQTFLNNIKNNIQFLDDTLEELKNTKMKTRNRLVRKSVGTTYNSAKQITNELWNLFKNNLKNTVKNEDIAKMYNIAYSGKLKNRNQRELDKRASDNTELFNKYFNKMEQINNIINPKKEELEKRYENILNKLGNCFYSTDNAIDLLTNGDCLAIGLKIKRVEGAISDPSKIEVLEICPSYIGSSVFQDAFEMSLAVNSSEQVHGNLNDNIGKVINGSSRDEINAILPLYLFEENWQIAKYWLRMSVGLSTTLDPLGYDYQQIITLPFLVLAKAITNYEENKSEHNKLIMDLILQTCQIILREDNELLDNIKLKLENYNTSPINRTCNIINNNTLFLMHIHVAQTLDLIDKISGNFAQNFIEENIRRENKFDINIDANILDILGVSKQEWVDNPIKLYKKSNTNVSATENMFKSNIEQLLNITQENKDVAEIKDENEEVIFVDPNTWICDVPDNQHNFNMWLDLEIEFKTQPFILLNCVLDQQVNFQNIKDFGINTNEKMLCFMLQSYIQHKNSKRVNAIESKLYRDPFCQEKSKEFVKIIFEKHIRDVRSNLINNINKMNVSQDSNSRADVFALTDDLAVAAGALYGTFVGVNISSFYLRMRNIDIVLRDEKVNMMISGRYKGIVLYADKYSWTDTHPGWTPRSRNLNGMVLGK